MLIDIGMLAMTAAVLAATGAGQQHDARTGQSAQERAATTQDDLTTVGGLLDAVERADRQTTGVSADIVHVVVNTLTGDTQQRRGAIELSTDWTNMLNGQPMRRFMVRFDQLVIGGVTDDDDQRLYTFDGRWLAERLESDKQFNRWELVAPGERLDPFEPVGGGAFWLPFGQSRAQIERVAEASIVDHLKWAQGDDMPEDIQRLVGALEQHAGAELVQLRLVPKAGTGFDRHWGEVRTWFHPRTLLPVLYLAVEATGDQQIAWLSRIDRKTQSDPPTEPGLFDTTPPTGSGWHVTERPYRGSEPLPGEPGDSEGERIIRTIPAPPPPITVRDAPADEAEPDGDAEGTDGTSP